MKDVAFFDSRRTGDLISRLSSDTAKIEGAISQQVAIFVKSLIYNLVVLVMFFLISWEMTLFTIGLMTPTLVLSPLYANANKKI